MIICSCNIITYNDIVKAIASGAKTYEEVLKYYNKVPDCRGCEKYITKLIVGEKDEH